MLALSNRPTCPLTLDRRVFLAAVLATQHRELASGPAPEEAGADGGPMSRSNGLGFYRFAYNGGNEV